MFETNLSKFIGSILRLCPKRLASSSAIEQNSNHPKEYVSNTLEISKITPQQYLHSDHILSTLKHQIPAEYVTRKKSLDSLYLIDSSIARQIAEQILPYLVKNKNKVIAECLPGLGLLTRQLLENKMGPLKLFEPSKFFREQLKKFALQESKMIQLYSKTLFKISQYHYSDRLDNGNRVQKLLKNVPKKGWTDDPAISVIGPILNNTFLQHVIYAISTQKSLVSYGRVEIFSIMRPSHYLVLSTEKDFYKSKYGYMTVLFNLFFDYKLLCKLPRQSFIPWERSCVEKPSTKLYSTDTNMLYLVHIVAKKQFPLPSDQLVAFNVFMRKFFKRKARIIPILEYCVPDCGVHVMMPQLEHEHYFEHIDIFTDFEELTPIQIVGVFREMYHHPNYKGSPFSAVVEASIMKLEAVQTDFVPGPENSFIDEIEELYEGCNLSEDSNIC